MSRIDACHDQDDLRRLARRRLPKGIFEFIDRGNEDEIAASENVRAFRRIKLLPRVLVDVSARSTRTTLLGSEAAMPVAVAPTGAAGLVWHEGELAMARAAAAAGVPFTLASGSMTAMEKIVRIEGIVPWFQCYVWQDRNLTFELIDRARKLGFRALFITVDNPVLSMRAYNARNGFGLPYVLNLRSSIDVLNRPGWLLGVLARYLVGGGMPRYVNYPASYQSAITTPTLSPRMLADSLTPDDLCRIRERWPGKLVVKGVLRPEDALRARGVGADAIVVSNHGGRNLDAAPAPIDVVSAIRAAVGPHMEILLDSGVRRGDDTLKALALGANGVMVGRVPLLATAAGGELGARKSLSFLQSELAAAMAYVGAISTDHIAPDLILGSSTATRHDSKMEEIA
ncbi:MAG: alpha-hydroxy-acid oxidizing enzyme [Shinella sp.]|nr:MAG: alpha-hydroxy-acid oxidizing enzyme [Shinella sp.]